VSSEASLAELKKHRAGLTGILENYGSLVPAEDRPAFEELGHNLQEYWQLIDPVLTWDDSRRRREGFAYLKRVVFPKRLELLAITDELGRLNDRHLQSVSDRSVATFHVFRSRLTGALFTSVGLGTLLGLLTSLYLLRLERDLVRRYAEITEARAELEQLSARIVDAQEQERRNISRELHDEVGQSLSALLVDVGNAAAAAPAGAVELDTRLRSIRGLAESCLQTVRNISLLLRPSMLDDFGLVPALHWQAREFLRRYHVDVSVRADELVDELPEAVRTCIYRVVQEALSNVARHAEAGAVNVLLQKEDGRLLVAIQDNGRGFDTGTVKGMGLLGMEERARRLNGAFRVESAPGKGTVVQLSLPLEDDDAGTPPANEGLSQVPA